MNYSLLSFGLMMIILGFIITYVMISSFIRITANFEQLTQQISSEAVRVRRNEIISNSLPGLVLVAIGVLLIKLGFRREGF